MWLHPGLTGSKLMQPWQASCWCWRWKFYYDPCASNWESLQQWCFQKAPCQALWWKVLFTIVHIPQNNWSIWNPTYPYQLSPTDTNERALHSAARRAGVTFPCEISYLDIPICSGFDDYGAPIVEVKQWPFLLPSDMVPCKYLQRLVVFFSGEPHSTKGYIYFRGMFQFALLCPCFRPGHWWMTDILRRSLTWTNWLGIGSTCWRIIQSILHLKAQVLPCRSRSMVSNLKSSISWYIEIVWGWFHVILFPII